jgi:hypothetical protein
MKPRIPEMSESSNAFCSPVSRFFTFTVPPSISVEPLMEMNGMAFFWA